MSTRERTLAILMIGLIVVGGGAFAGYLFIYEPIQEKKAASAKLQEEINALQEREDDFRKNFPRLKVAKQRSLPADENVARQEHYEMMSRLVRQAGIPLGYTITTKPAPDANAIPKLPGTKTPIYTKVVVDIEFKRADMWVVHDFLTSYYRLNLLHQITHFSIKKDDDAAAAKNRPAGDRRDLTVKVTTEALILDGAEPRRTLLPVSNAFAAVGGMVGYDAVALNPDMGRGIAPLQLAPVLASRTRDYTMIVQKDPFHGPYPKPDGLGVDKIADVAATVGEPIPSVKVPIKGEPGYLGTVTLTATPDNGKLFPAGSVKVDQTNRSISLTPAKEEIGSAKFTVVAKAANGQEVKATFAVSIDTPPTERKPGEGDDISPAVILIGITSGSDGAAVAAIRDNATPVKYEVEASAKGINVVKYYYLNGQKRKDLDYESPKLLTIADGSPTKPATLRVLKIVAVNDDSLIVQDVTPPAKPAAKPAAPKFPGAPAAAPAKPTPAAVNGPLAAVVGLAAGSANPPTALLRWPAGKSLAAMKPVAADEAAKILRRAAVSGPLGSGIVAEAVEGEIPAPRAAGN